MLYQRSTPSNPNYRAKGAFMGTPLRWSVMLGCSTPKDKIYTMELTILAVSSIPILTLCRATILILFMIILNRHSRKGGSATITLFIIKNNSRSSRNAMRSTTSPPTTGARWRWLARMISAPTEPVGRHMMVSMIILTLLGGMTPP